MHWLNVLLSTLLRKRSEVRLWCASTVVVYSEIWTYYLISLWNDAEQLFIYFRFTPLRAKFNAAEAIAAGDCKIIWGPFRFQHRLRIVVATCHFGFGQIGSEETLKMIRLGLFHINKKNYSIIRRNDHRYWGENVVIFAGAVGRTFFTTFPVWQ